MKLKTTIATFVLGFIVLVTLCIRINPSIEGLNTMKTNTQVLHRGQYIDDVGYLKSKDDNYKLMLRNGTLHCFLRNRHGAIWTMNARGSNIMLLNDYGILQFKQSRESEPIIQMSKDANSLVLTSYGTLEMKSGMDGAGTTLWAYPVKEGFEGEDEADNALTDLTSEIDIDRGALTQHTIKNLNASFTNGDGGGINPKLPNDAVTTGWATFTAKNSNANDDDEWTNKTTVADYAAIHNDQITIGADGHDTLLQNRIELNKLRSELDNKLSVLNQLDGEHQTNMGSTIYISLVWTVVASSLVYYTFTQ